MAQIKRTVVPRRDMNLPISAADDVPSTRRKAAGVVRSVGSNYRKNVLHRCGLSSLSLLVRSTKNTVHLLAQQN